MKIPILGALVGERFLTHRLRSSSMAGIIGGVLSIVLFEYRYAINHVWSWDLFTVAVTIVSVKLTMMIWYRLTD